MRWNMKYRYVVIEREYGSGGTRIGELLSERTGMPCYGSEILKGVSDKLQIPISDIEQYEENTTNSFLYSLYALGRISGESSDLLSNENRIFLEEQKLIREYAMQGAAIFVGRCAAAALDEGGVLTVFIHADRESRKRRAVEEYGVSGKMADSVVAKYDKKRRNFYSVNTGKKWSDWNNYDMVLDSGKLGLERCADIVRAALG